MTGNADHSCSSTRTDTVELSSEDIDNEPKAEPIDKDIDDIALAAASDDYRSDDERLYSSYFRHLQHELSREMVESERRLPKCYETGTFWITPPSVFLSMWNKQQPQPQRRQPDDSDDRLQRPRVFVWLVHLLVEQLGCPSCKGNARLESDGWATSPCAHRILDLGNDFYLMSYRYKCNHCERIFLGHDQAVRDMLPDVLQAEFPAVLLHHSAVSRATIELLQRCCSDPAVGIGFVTKVVKNHNALHIKRSEQHKQQQQRRCASPQPTQPPPCKRRRITPPAPTSLAGHHHHQRHPTLARIAPRLSPCDPLPCTPRLTTLRPLAPNPPPPIAALRKPSSASPSSSSSGTPGASAAVPPRYAPSCASRPAPLRPLAPNPSPASVPFRISPSSSSSSSSSSSNNSSSSVRYPSHSRKPIFILPNLRPSPPSGPLPPMHIPKRSRALTKKPA